MLFPQLKVKCSGYFPCLTRIFPLLFCIRSLFSIVWFGDPLVDEDTSAVEREASMHLVLADDCSGQKRVVGRRNVRANAPVGRVGAMRENAVDGPEAERRG